MYGPCGEDGTLHSLLMGMQATLEKRLAIFYKTHSYYTYDPVIMFLAIYPNKVKVYVHVKTDAHGC